MVKCGFLSSSNGKMLKTTANQWVHFILKVKLDYETILQGFISILSNSNKVYYRNE